MYVYLNDPTDCDWLRTTHLKGTEYAALIFESFILHGNEDWPTKIELYRSRDPRTGDRATVLVSYQDETTGEMMLRRDN